MASNDGQSTAGLLQTDVEDGLPSDVAGSESPAWWRRSIVVGGVMAVAALAALCAASAGTSRTGPLSARVLNGLVLNEDFKTYPDSYFRAWHTDEDAAENKAAAFKHFVKESRFGDELSALELAGYKVRFMADCDRATKKLDFDEAPETSDLKQVIWRQALRETVENEKPEVTEASVSFINGQDLGFTVRKTTRMDNISRRQVLSKMGIRRPDDFVETPIPRTVSSNRAALPKEFHAHEKWPHCEDVILRLHNQGACGSCWAFAAMQTLDSRLCVATEGGFSGSKAMLSRTFATTCVAHTDDGCQGGWPTWAFDLSAHGIPLGGTDGCVPYFGSGEGRDHFDFQQSAPPCPDACKATYPRTMAQDRFSFGAAGQTQSYGASTSGSHDEVRRAIFEGGPIVGVVHVDNAFFAYDSGVYNSGCQNSVNHAITVSGWGVHEKKDYFAIVNSWGATDHEGQMKVAPCVLQVMQVPSAISDMNLPSPTFAQRDSGGGDDDDSEGDNNEGDNDEEQEQDGCQEDEKLSGDKDADYRGCQTATRDGRTCQKWSAQSPHTHTRTPDRNPNKGLEKNYCRNPDGESTIWCYTTDKDHRWDFCDPLEAAPPVPEKIFTVSEGDCTVDEEGCIRSPNYPDAYPSNGVCEITVEKECTLQVRKFDTEAGRDYLKLDNNDNKVFEGDGGPHLHMVKSQISWFSDRSVEGSGWHVCAELHEHPDPAAAYQAKCEDTGDDIAEPHGTTLEVNCPESCNHKYMLWGTDMYTRDSNICTAGMHATGGRHFRVKFIDGHLPPAPQSYPHSHHNDILSSDWASQWAETIEVQEF